ASSLISAPATNAFSPAPVRITTRTAASFLACSKPAPSSRTVAELSAFRTAGRLTVMIAIASRFSYKRFSNIPPSVQWFGIRRVLMIVETPTALASVVSGQNHTFQQRWRRETFLTELFEHDVGNVVRRIEPDEVQQSEWSHW